MRNFRNIVVLQLRHMFRGDRSRKSRAQYVAYAALALVYVLIMVAMLPVVYGFSQTFAALELQSELVALVLMVGTLTVLVFGIVTVLTTLYFSRDTEFFLSLPVPSSTVFAAKIAVVYLIEAATTLLLMTPFLVCIGIGMHMSAVYYCLIPLAILLTPAIPLFFASIIAIPVMYIVSFFRNRGTLGSLLVLLLFGAFFILYYVAIFKIQKVDDSKDVIDNMRGVFQKTATVAYPLYALARAMAGARVFGMSTAAATAVNLAIYIGSVAAFGVIAFIISATVYRKGAASQLENVKRTNREASYRGTSVLRTLMKKEWREIVRTPSFAMNCLLGIVVSPIIVGFFVYMTRFQTSAEAEQLDASARQIGNAILSFFTLWFLVFMSTGTNSAPTTAFSREGEKFAYCKLIPVEYRTQLKAKSYVSLAIGFAASLLGLAVYAVMVRDIVFTVCSAVFLLLYNYAYVHFTMLLDLSRPKLHWTTPNEAIKHNRNVMLSTFGGAGASLVSVFLGGLTYVLLYAKGHAVLASVLCWTILLVLGFALAAISSSLLYMRCEKKFDAVEM